MISNKFFPAALSLLLLSAKSKADVVPNSLFSENMVLQRGTSVPIWGKAEENEKVTITFGKQTVSTVTKDGKWAVKLNNLKEGGPFVLTIKGNNTITINNVFVGEVWLCSGQSNMGFPLRAIRPVGEYPKADEVLKDAQNYPLIHFYSVATKKSTATPPPSEDAKSKWLACDSITSKNFSAVAYFFARELYSKYKVPIGILQSAYGGTQGENWISKEVLESTPVLQKIFPDFEKNLAEYPSKVEKFKNDEPRLLEKYHNDSALAKQNNKELPRKPAMPANPAERGGPSGLFNSMINPLIPYALKGAVWYQGEANASRGIQYRALLPALIHNWRDKWAMGDFPFLIVQIPGWKAHNPEIREAQLLTWQKTPNTCMTVITDCDDTLDVHPGNKQPVGERLALAARGVAYKEKIEYAGPVYQSMKVEGNKAILTFTHAEGLVAKGGELKDFTIAGKDKNFVPAHAEIKGNKVEVWSDNISDPSAVRLGWRLSPQVNLYNKAGLLATAFRTDVDYTKQ